MMLMQHSVNSDWLFNTGLYRKLVRRQLWTLTCPIYANNQQQTIYIESSEVESESSLLYRNWYWGIFPVWNQPRYHPIIYRFLTEFWKFNPKLTKCKIKDRGESLKSKKKLQFHIVAIAVFHFSRGNKLTILALNKRCSAYSHANM